MMIQMYTPPKLFLVYHTLYISLKQTWSTKSVVGQILIKGTRMETIHTCDKKNSVIIYRSVRDLVDGSSY